MKKEVNIFWFRRDLRLIDNMALFHALDSNIPVIPIFIFDKKILSSLDNDDARVSFIHESLLDIREKLKKVDSDLLTIFDDPLKAWDELIEKFNINSVYTNEDYEEYGINRDIKISNKLKKNDIKFHSYKDHCIFSKFDVLKKDKTPYTVFTPYKNKWIENLSPRDMLSIKSENKKANFLKGFRGKLHSLKSLGFIKSKITSPARLIKKKTIENYHLKRDIPSLDATSHLGIHLRFGTLSVRKCVQVAYELNRTWLSELIWREFFMQIMYHFPHVKDASFRSKYDKIQWLNDKKQFKKWCNGETGYPIVDAGMRELNQSGHMHNRVRMICASFLVKDLLIDWRWGEKYFASKLLDFELASNNGNWQWAAGTGCDAAPYFRVFNPDIQLKKFDPDLIYIKKWIPEFGTDSYAQRMVDHKSCAQRAIMTYKKYITTEV